MLCAWVVTWHRTQRYEMWSIHSSWRTGWAGGWTNGDNDGRHPLSTYTHLPHVCPATHLSLPTCLSGHSAVHPFTVTSLHLNLTIGRGLLQQGRVTIAAGIIRQPWSDREQERLWRSLPETIPQGKKEQHVYRHKSRVKLSRPALHYQPLSNSQIQLTSTPVRGPVKEATVVLLGWCQLYLARLSSSVPRNKRVYTPGTWHATIPTTGFAQLRILHQETGSCPRVKPVPKTSLWLVS